MTFWNQLDERAKALAMHCPPAVLWYDDDGVFHKRCITDSPHADCMGCRETGQPTGIHVKFDPPVQQ